MIALDVGAWVAALLLVGAGLAKVARPHNTARALGVHPSLLRAGSLVELALGISGLALGGTVTRVLSRRGRSPRLWLLSRHVDRGARPYDDLRAA